MDNKRILLVGDGNNIFVVHYAHWLKQLDPSIQLDIFSTTQVNQLNSEYYTHIHCLHGSRYFQFINKIKFIRRYLLIPLYFNQLKNLKGYDYVHFHFISPLIYSLIHLISLFTKSRIILSLWGSDLYRVNPIDALELKKVCKKATAISFGNLETIAYFRKKFEWKKENLHLCRFGLSPLEDIQQHTSSVEESKLHLHWNPQKLAVCIGYNASQGQQHLQVLECFQKDELKELKEQIQLIVPLSYGGNNAYREEIKAYLNQLPYETHIYESYMTSVDLAHLRRATDIMIQVQTTDQFSGSMQEHLFAGNVVITGSWLPYKTIKTLGISFEEVNRIDEINHLLGDIVRHFDDYKHKTTQNAEKILELSSWSTNIKQWYQLYV